MGSMLTNNSFYQDGYFDHVYIISPSADTDATALGLFAKRQSTTILSDPEVLENVGAWLENLMENQKAANKGRRVLVILDDLIGHLKKNVANLCTRYRVSVCFFYLLLFFLSSIFLFIIFYNYYCSLFFLCYFLISFFFFLLLRPLLQHYNLSLWVTTQLYKRIDITIRNCASALIFFNLNNKVNYNFYYYYYFIIIIFIISIIIYYYFFIYIFVFSLFLSFSLYLSLLFLDRVSKDHGRFW